METNELRIDVPVKLARVKNVFSIASLSFEGDLPAALFHLKLLMDDVGAWNASAQVVAVFHTNAGHVTLHDQSYNSDRNIDTGNPYKGLLVNLIDRGARIELCGATAQAHGWTNADTLKGVQINTDAMARTTELVQQGFVMISES
ncbi:DsrE family protein [Lysobacter niastensis]|nr:DsrE family protein [Lysobacter niastensis]